MSKRKAPKPKGGGILDYFTPDSKRQALDHDDDDGDIEGESNRPTTSAAASTETSQSQASETTTAASKQQDQDQPGPSGNQRSFKHSWLADFEWLEVIDESADLVVCKYCRESPQIAGKTELAKPTGMEVTKRDTLTKHSKSNRHQRCVSVAQRPNVEHSSVAVQFARTNQSTQDKTEYELEVKMNTAYTIAKEEMSFTKMRPLLLLQRKNGLEITPTYANHVQCKNMVSTIADVQKDETKDKIENSKYISTMFDGATDYSVRESGVLYVRHLEEGKPVNRLIGLTDVQNASAEGVTGCIISTFENFQLPSWDDSLVGMCCDGASVNLGQSGGVVAKLREKIPHLIDIHCMAHRLELALHDVQKSVPMVKKVDNVLNDTYKTYHKSPKSKRELEILCEELETRFYMPKPVKGTRWVPHLDRAIKQYVRTTSKDWVNDSGCYSAVQMHMESLSNSTEPAVAGRAKKVSKDMVDCKFVAICHFMADVFEQVAELSLEFQKDDLILPLAISALDNCITVLTSMKDAPLDGGLLDQLVTNCFKKQDGDTAKFQGLELTRYDGDPAQLLSDISATMEKVIDVTLKELDNRFNNLLGKNEDKQTQKVVKAFGAFHHDQWPDNKALLLRHGNDDMRVLLAWFDPILQRQGCSTDQVMTEWRKLKTLVKSNFAAKPYLELYTLLLTKEPYCTDYKNVLHLVELMLVLPISSANCERAFSAQKRIVTGNRSSMAVSTASDLILLSTEGPKLETFDPKPAVQKWKEDKDRRPLCQETWSEDIIRTMPPSSSSK